MAAPNDPTKSCGDRIVLGGPNGIEAPHEHTAECDPDEHPCPCGCDWTFTCDYHDRDEADA